MPIEPEDPTPTDPSEPEDPTPTEPNDDTSSELPNTATNIFNILLIGFGLFALGIVGMGIRRESTI